MFRVFFAFLVFLQPVVIFAQTQGKSSSSEEIFFQEIPSVFGASRFEQKLTEAPSSVTIVTQSDIKKFGYRTLSDLLRSVRGFFTTNDRNYSYIGVRGFGRPGDYNTRVLLLVDGHKINDNVFDQAFIGTDFPVDIDLIDKVEIIRGPSSSIYGANAFFGVINIITRRGRDLKGMELSGEAGRFDTYKSRASYGDRFSNGVEVLLSGSYYNSTGSDLFFKEFNNRYNNHGVAQGCDWDNFYNVFSKLRMEDFTLEGVYSSRQKGIPTAPWGGWFNDPDTSTTDERGYFDLRYDHSFSNDLSVMGRLFYDHYDYEGVFPMNRANLGDPLDIYHWNDSALGDWGGGEFQITKTIFESHKLLAGLEFQDNFRQNQGVYVDTPFSRMLDSKKSTFNYGLYVEDQYHVLKDLILNAGLRYDNFQTFGDTLNPRAALIYNPFEKTVFKLIYGEAFRSPNAYELYYDDGSSQKASQNLRPEKIHTYEAAWEQYIGDIHLMTASVYYYRVNDLISLRKDPADDMLVYANLDKVKAGGFEWEFDSKWKSGIETRVSYAFQETINDLTDTILTNSPVHQAKLNFIFPIVKDRVFVGTEFQYMSPRTTLDGNRTDSVFLTNLTVFTRGLAKGLELSASVYNLFNQKFGDPGSDEHVQDVIEQDGINFRIKVTYSF